MMLLALLIPPLAVLLSGRPVQAVFNALLWLSGLVLIVLPFVPGLMTWGLAVVWAVLVVRGRRQEARDRRLVETALAQDRARRPGLSMARWLSALGSLLVLLGLAAAWIGWDALLWIPEAAVAAVRRNPETYGVVAAGLVLMILARMLGRRGG